MSSISRSRVRGLCLIVALFALAVSAPVAHAAPQYGGPPTANGGTYLALGDSLAFGYQAYKVTACGTPAAGFCSSPDTQFSTGYVNVFASSFAGAYPGVNTVNLGCPGETSGSLIDGSGPYPNSNTTGCNRYPFAIHNNHPGQTQLQAAVQVLRDQGKKVNPVTLDIGANDVLAIVNGCGGFANFQCIQDAAPAAFASIEANIDSTLNTLRAEGGKTKEIIVIGLYNPLYVAILGAPATWTPAKIATAAASDALTNSLNALTRSTAAKYNAEFVDPMPTFNPGNGANPPVEFGTLCALTLMCTPPNTQPGNPGGDIHASDAGYQALGSLTKTASGY